MLTINGTTRPTCAGISRRQLLQIGGAGLFGMSLPNLLAARPLAGAPTGGKAKSVIFLFLFGGPSQLETFDMKPEAKLEVRGPFKPIRSKTPDLLICEHLSRLAAISNKFAVLRSLTHSFNDHSGGAHYIQTGKRWHIPIGGGFSKTPDDWPSMGSVVEYLGQAQPGGMERDLASYVVLPNRLGHLQAGGQYVRPGEYAGWLGQAFNPLTTRIDKRDEKDNPYWRPCDESELGFEIEALRPSIALGRLRERATLLEQFEALRTRLDSGAADALDVHRKRALSLIASDKTREALNLKSEPDSIRDRYGRHLFGQSCLMARRMVEAGTRFVTVHYDCVDGYSWDSHRNSEDVRDHLLPTFDQACSALLCDLEERGLLSETLVIALGEMGRTPNAKGNWGRDHWSTCFPALLAGAGIRGGIVYGKSDRDAAYPIEKPVSPEDIAKTLYWSLGVDPEMMLHDRQNRPVPLVESGRPLHDLFG
jgi:hypothetical protein